MILIENKDARPDWATIEAEYVSGEIGTYKLADKYGIPHPSLRYHYEKEEWGRKRKEYRQKLVEKTSQKTARDRHLATLSTARAELRTLHKDTPHRRDLLRHIHRMEKELRIYDHYHTQRG